MSEADGTDPGAIRTTGSSAGGSHATDRADDQAGDRADARVDWEALRQRARDMLARAYVPYSHYPVGAAALVDDGRVVCGCNVENAGYGVTLCAECGLVSELVAGGGGRLVAFTCCNRQGDVIMPCGRCRQLLWEHGGAELLVETPQGVWTMDRVLPQAFGPESLDI